MHKHKIFNVQLNKNQLLIDDKAFNISNNDIDKIGIFLYQGHLISFDQAGFYSTNAEKIRKILYTKYKDVYTNIISKKIIFIEKDNINGFASIK